MADPKELTHDAAAPSTENAQRKDMRRSVVRRIAGREPPTFVEQVRGPSGTPYLLVVERMARGPNVTDAQAASYVSSARAVAGLQHANVVRGRAVSVRQDEIVVATDFVDGERLSELWRTLTAKGSNVPIDVAVRILLDVLAGLEALHAYSDPKDPASKLIHGEVTAANVLVGADGVARLLHTARIRRPGALPPDASSIAPEVVSGQAIDLRADVFSVGVLLWQALSGVVGLAVDMDLVTRIRTGKVERAPAPKDAPWGAPLVDVAARAMSVAPADRFPSASSMSGELRKLIRNALPDAAKVAAFVQANAGPKIDERRHRARVAEGVVAGSSAQRPEAVIPGPPPAPTVDAPKPPATPTQAVAAPAAQPSPAPAAKPAPSPAAPQQPFPPGTKASTTLIGVNPPPKAAPAAAAPPSAPAANPPPAPAAEPAAPAKPAAAPAKPPAAAAAGKPAPPPAASAPAAVKAPPAAAVAKPAPPLAAPAASAAKPAAPPAAPAAPAAAVAKPAAAPAAPVPAVAKPAPAAAAAKSPPAAAKPQPAPTPAAAKPPATPAAAKPPPVAAPVQQAAPAPAKPPTAPAGAKPAPAPAQPSPPPAVPSPAAAKPLPAPAAPAPAPAATAAPLGAAAKIEPSRVVDVDAEAESIPPSVPASDDRPVGVPPVTERPVPLEPKVVIGSAKTKDDEGQDIDLSIDPPPSSKDGGALAPAFAALPTPEAKATAKSAQKVAPRKRTDTPAAAPAMAPAPIAKPMPTESSLRALPSTDPVPAPRRQGHKIFAAVAALCLVIGGIAAYNVWKQPPVGSDGAPASPAANPNTPASPVVPARPPVSPAPPPASVTAAPAAATAQPAKTSEVSSAPEPVPAARPIERETEEESAGQRSKTSAPQTPHPAVDSPPATPPTAPPRPKFDPKRI